MTDPKGIHVNQEAAQRYANHAQFLARKLIKDLNRLTVLKFPERATVAMIALNLVKQNFEVHIKANPSLGDFNEIEACAARVVDHFFHLKKVKPMP